MYCRNTREWKLPQEKQGLSSTHCAIVKSNIMMQCLGEKQPIVQQALIETDGVEIVDS